jgi:phosphonate transport system substrate-binding protein
MARRALLVGLPLALLLGGVGVWAYAFVWAPAKRFDFLKSIRAALVSPDKLDEAFTDADGDLVADPPTDPAKWVDPPTLRFATLGPDFEREKKAWKDFLPHLAKVTGKKVELVPPPLGGQGAIERMKEGTLHVLALSTGAVPRAVNTAGFVPVCVMADEKGNYAYQMEILVPSDSPIQSTKDLRGTTLAFTSMSSLSSFKAPLVLLWKEHGMLPRRDYEFLIVSSQEQAIRGVVEKEYQAVAVANDLLQRVVASRGLDARRYRSIYKSDSYPPACFGHVHDLAPATAKKVREAFLTFPWPGTSLAEAYKAANQTRFVAISYKKDWESVRAVDQAIRAMVEQAR